MLPKNCDSCPGNRLIINDAHLTEMQVLRRVRFLLDLPKNYNLILVGQRGLNSASLEKGV